MPASRNVLHLIADDLRPELGAYGLNTSYTPHLDRLAAEGVAFDRAYAQQAVCGPSRNSFMSGRRPDASKSWNFINHFREEHPDWTTLPGLFKAAGALALGLRFVLYAVRLLRGDDRRVALNTFKYSITYLMSLFVVLLVDHFVFF